MKTCPQCKNEFDPDQVERSLGSESAVLRTGHCSANCYTKTVMNHVEENSPAKGVITAERIAKFADLLNASAGENRSRGGLFLSCAKACGFSPYDLPKPATANVPDSRFGGWKELKVFTIFEGLFLIFDPRRGARAGQWYATTSFPDDIDRASLRGEEFFASEHHDKSIDYNAQTVELKARRVTRRDTSTGAIVDEVQINICTTTLKGEKNRAFSDSFGITLRPDQVDMLIAAIGKPRPLLK